jgi:hypothetical protein
MNIVEADAETGEEMPDKKLTSEKNLFFDLPCSPKK